MRVLITAGNTQTPIDRVRCLTNIFTGRTGGRIAVEARARGHAVTLLTSHPDTVVGVEGLAVNRYRTFDDLRALMAELVPAGQFDVIIHTAAVSDSRWRVCSKARLHPRFRRARSPGSSAAGTPSFG